MYIYIYIYIYMYIYICIYIYKTKILEEESQGLLHIFKAFWPGVYTVGKDSRHQLGS